MVRTTTIASASNWVDSVVRAEVEEYLYHGGHKISQSSTTLDYVDLGLGDFALTIHPHCQNDRCSLPEKIEMLGDVSFISRYEVRAAWMKGNLNHCVWRH